MKLRVPVTLEVEVLQSPYDKGPPPTIAEAQEAITKTIANGCLATSSHEPSFYISVKVSGREEHFAVTGALGDLTKTTYGEPQPTERPPGYWGLDGYGFRYLTVGASAGYCPIGFGCFCTAAI